MYLSFIPKDVRQYIFFYIKLKDIAAVYEALEEEPSLKELDILSEQRRLPYGRSLDILVAFEDIEEKRILKYCIRYNDFPSFRRLYTSEQKEVFRKSVGGLPRPKFVRHYLDTKEVFGKEDLELACKNGLFKEALFIANQGVDIRNLNLISYNEFTLTGICDFSPELQKQALSIAVSRNYNDLTRKLLTLGVTIDFGQIIGTQTPPDILHKLLLLDAKFASQAAYIVHQPTQKNLPFLRYILQNYTVDVKVLPKYLVSLFKAKLFLFSEVKKIAERHGDPDSILHQFVIRLYEPHSSRRVPGTSGDEWNLKGFLLKGDYDSVRGLLNTGNKGRCVMVIPDDLPLDLIDMLSDIQWESERTRLFDLAVDYKSQKTLCKLLEYYGLKPILNSRKKAIILDLLVKAGSIVEEFIPYLLSN